MQCFFGYRKIYNYPDIYQYPITKKKITFEYISYKIIIQILTLKYIFFTPQVDVVE